ncbi:hypothetical protein AYO49_01445 [Verrucomicrobiaceae bacterium SCGC AG-212-N21]|nr:hypothetical protein AYO49_01445 [Verrucomicrobiaceae bacterium SCGC AG-212-N21]
MNLATKAALCILAFAAMGGPPLASAISARFVGTAVVIHDSDTKITIPDLTDEHAFYQTIHAVCSSDGDYFLLLGTSELTRGWPPKSGMCGCGIESYIEWLHIRSGKVIARKQAHYQSCRMNRDGWSIEWKSGKLLWSTRGSVRREEAGNLKFVSMDYSWEFDPRHPEKGIVENAREASTP